MRHTISDLWYGEISPYSEKSENSKHILELYKHIDHHRKIISEQLNEDGLKALDELDDYQSQVHAIEDLDAFAKGFRLGVRLMCEAIDD